MSRRGIAGIKQRQAMAAKKQELGHEIEKKQLEEMSSQLQEFKQSLEAFAVKHK